MAARNKRVRSPDARVSPTPARKDTKVAVEAATAEEADDVLVFVTDDVAARAGLQAKVHEFSEALGVEVVTSWRQGVTHVVTTSKWLSSNRNVEWLFVLAEISRVRHVVSHDWITASLELRDVAAGAAFALALPAEFAAARERAPRLLAGNVLFFGGKFDTPPAAAAAAAHKEGSSKASGYSSAKLSADKRDLVVLASLHGAEVVDVLNRTPLLLGAQGTLYRGYSFDDLRARIVTAAADVTTRVILSSQDAVTKLGLETYTQAKLQPLLQSWLLYSIRDQEVHPVDRHVICAVTK